MPLLGMSHKCQPKPQGFQVMEVRSVKKRISVRWLINGKYLAQFSSDAN